MTKIIDNKVVNVEGPKETFYPVGYEMCSEDGYTRVVMNSLPADAMPLKEFAKGIEIKQVIYTSSLFHGVTRIRVGFYIVVQDNNRYLASKRGDMLYDVQELNDEMVLTQCRMKSFVDWKLNNHFAPNARGVKDPMKAVQFKWFKEGDCVVTHMMQHPGRTYNECVFVARQEGFDIVDGFITRK